MIMKKSAFMLLIILLSLTANAQTPYRNEDGKKIDKEELETKAVSYTHIRAHQTPINLGLRGRV